MRPYPERNGFVFARLIERRWIIVGLLPTMALLLIASAREVEIAPHPAMPESSAIAYSQYSRSGDEYDSADWSVFVAGAECASPELVAANAQFTSWSPSGDELLYVSRQEEKGDIFALSLDARGKPRRLTDNDVHDTHPAWSPDGRAIAFVSNRDGSSKIYLMDTSGEHVRQLTLGEGNDNNPQWSGDGHKLVFFREIANGPDRIVILDIASGHESMPPQPDGINTFPTFDSTGMAITYTSSPVETRSVRLWRTDLKTGSFQQISKIEAFYGRVSPDRSKHALIGGQWPQSHIAILRLPIIQPE